LWELAQAGLTAGVYAMQRKLNPLINDAGEAGGQLINIYPEKTVANHPSVTEIHAHELSWYLVDHRLPGQGRHRDAQITKGGVRLRRCGHLSRQVPADRGRLWRRSARG